MDRLTIRNGDGSISQPTHSTFERVFNRLAEYEDTDFDPDELKQILSNHSEFLYHMTGGKLSRNTYTAEDMISVAEYYSQSICENYCDDRKELDEYKRAEADRRLVRLPCKVGDTVYEIQKIRKRVQPLEIISVYIGRMGDLFFIWELKDGLGILQNVKGFGLSQLGKTVFFTREEAEKALEGAEE